MDVETGLTLILLALFVVLAMAFGVQNQRKLEDPDDDSVVYLEEVKRISLLQSGGEYVVKVYRQSGNPQQDDRVFKDKNMAIQAAISTFRRAKIESVSVDRNTETELVFRRTFYSHRGSSEGKKVGSAEIYKIS